jgi:O-antigen ligase
LQKRRNAENSSGTFKTKYAVITAEEVHVPVRNATQQVYFWSLMLLSFSLPFYRWMVTPAIILLACTWLANYRNWELPKHRFIRTQSILLISLFFIFAAGLLHTEDLKEGFFDLEVKLGMLVLPLIIFTTKPLLEKQFSAVLKAFLAGNILSVFICLFVAFYRSTTFDGGVHFDATVAQQGEGFWHSIVFGGNYFFYSDFSIFKHPAYFTLYISFALTAFFWLWKRNQTTVSLIWKIVIIMLLSFGVVLLSSRVGMIVYLLTLILVPLALASTIVKRLRIAALAILLTFVGGYFIWNNPRTEIVITELKQTFLDDDFDQSSGIGQRLMLWNAALQIIQENPLIGVGVGDVHASLNKKYKESGNTIALDAQLNVHNQFLEIAIALGLIGFLVFFTIIVWLLYFSLQNRNILLFVLILQFCLNCFLESMLNTQSGVVFWAFLTAILVHSNFSQESKGNVPVISD